jgi:hypothetical protein
MAKRGYVRLLLNFDFQRHGTGNTIVPRIHSSLFALIHTILQVDIGNCHQPNS